MGKFIKDFIFENEMVRMKGKYDNSCIKYGLIGEERVAYQLRMCNSDIICLYNVIIRVSSEKVQFDFLVVSPVGIYIVEVKNLLGNIYINKNEEVQRLIYKKDGMEVCGMENPFVQLRRQKELLQKFLIKNGYEIEVKMLLIMANPKTVICNESDNDSILKFDILTEILEKDIGNKRLNEREMEIANFILGNNIIYDYKLIGKIKKGIHDQYIPSFKNRIDEELYIKILEFRKEYGIVHNIPFCNVFTNKDAEQLVICKPKNKEEFVRVKGFKEKKFHLFGEEIIKIFKN